MTQTHCKRRCIGRVYQMRDSNVIIPKSFNRNGSVMTKTPLDLVDPKPIPDLEVPHRLAEGPNVMKIMSDNRRKNIGKQEGSGLSLAGSGLSLAGGDLTLAGLGLDDKNTDPLPGAMLRKKLLKNFSKTSKRKLIKNDGQSAGRTLPDSEGFELDTGPPIAGSGLHPRGGALKLAGGHKQEGGFIFAALGAIIAAISAGVSAAAATTIVGGVTAGAIAGAALTGAAGAAGALIVNKIAGKGIKESILKAIKKVKVTITDFVTKDKVKLLAAYKILKQDPSKKALSIFARKIAPTARKILKKKLAKKIDMSKIGQKGSGQAKKFDALFVKNFTKQLTK